MENNKEYCIVITTTDSQKVASDISSYLVENKLAACVQVDEITSFFYWEKKLCQTKEFRLMIKTLTSKYKDIEAAVQAQHNYSLPEIIRLDIAAGLPGYLSWIKNTLQ